MSDEVLTKWLAYILSIILLTPSFLFRNDDMNTVHHKIRRNIENCLSLCTVYDVAMGCGKLKPHDTKRERLAMDVYVYS